MNLSAGREILINVARWPDIEPEERTPRNATMGRELLAVIGCEWIGQHQRMVVRLASQRGELCLTQHELALNGARQ